MGSFANKAMTSIRPSYFQVRSREPDFTVSGVRLGAAVSVWHYELGTGCGGGPATWVFGDETLFQSQGMTLVSAKESITGVPYYKDRRFPPSGKNNDRETVFIDVGELNKHFVAVGYHVTKVTEPDDNRQYKIGCIKCESTEMVLVSFKRKVWDTHVLLYLPRGYLKCTSTGTQESKGLYHFLRKDDSQQQ